MFNLTFFCLWQRNNSSKMHPVISTLKRDWSWFVFSKLTIGVCPKMRQRMWSVYTYAFEKFTNHIDYIFLGRHLKSFLCQWASLVPFFISINQSIDLPFWWHLLQLRLNLYPRKKTPIADVIWMLFIPIFTLYRINPYFGETLTMSILSEKKIKCHIFNISPNTCTQQAGLDTFVINVYIVKTRNIYTYM